MKHKLITASLALITALSSNTFAYEIHKGKVIQEKQWSTNGAEGKFVSLTPNKAQQLKLSTKRRDRNGIHITVDANINPAKTTTNTITTIKGSNYVYLENNSNADRQYTINIETCSFPENNKARCISYLKEIILEAQGWYHDTPSPELKVSYNNNGTYPLSSMISAYHKDPSDQIEHRFYSSANSSSKIEVN